MTTINTTLADLPRVFQHYADQIPYATSVALNDTAFGLMREEKKQLDRHLELRNTWTQRGMRVEKASKHKLQASVGNVRWWIETLVDGGRRRPQIGINHKGKRYLLVPHRDMKTKSGRLKKIKSKNPFVINKGDDLWLVYRKYKRKAYPLEFVGRLVDETTYDEGQYPLRSISADYIGKHFQRNWRKAMMRAARSAR